MVEQVTRGIKISVETSFEGTFYKNYKVLYSFGYKVTIENQSSYSVQLDSRHWEIYDALNNIEIVDGEGVIGQKPILEPRESHTYTSGCLLSSPFGAMDGYYKMISLSSGEQFRVMIPSFKLNAPVALN
ncbi:Co2+/Mg2+ efflux protein ApaG [Flavobacteriaceae bacterium AU392]|nr:Co2+/Mg2+ efflux protein ApaG [Flavobacteriaceae bacterium]RKM82858.1 Co2+/Mg2+ efflux protein ApaG [Flavobacteriaceae bacterium AU392]